MVSLFKGYGGGYEGLIPPYLVLTEPQGRFEESGFLGSKFKPFATGGDPSQVRFAVEGIVAAGITERQQRNRKVLLDKLNTLPHQLPGSPAMQAFAKSEQQAYDMILGDGAKVFDLTTEKDETRALYGRSKFGQSCLVARRLVEKGVPYITINYPGWDTHKDNFQTMRRKLPEFDKGLSTLLQDLADRGLLDQTIVWCGGEFGRTPKVQWDCALERWAQSFRSRLQPFGGRRRLHGWSSCGGLGCERRSRQGSAGVPERPDWKFLRTARNCCGCQTSPSARS